MGWISNENGELPWLEVRIPKFYEVRLQGGGARKKNPPKDAYLEVVYDEYTAKFPDREKTFHFTEIGLKGTPAERKAKMITRLNDWFGNQLRNGLSGKGGKQEVVDLTGKHTSQARGEKNFDTYARLHKDRILPILEKAYSAYRADCEKTGEKPKPELAFRNIHLPKMLAAEPAEVQEEVASKRMTAADRKAKLLPKWEDSETCGGEELERRSKAFDLHQDLALIVRTIERAGGTLQKMGWNSVILVGGPEPKHNGDVKVIGMTNGCTIPAEGGKAGQVFEEYHPGWQKLMDSFTDFCGKTTTEEDRAKLSLSIDKPKEDTPAKPAAPSPATVTPPDTQSKALTTTDAIPIDNPQPSMETIVVDSEKGDGYLVTKEFDGKLIQYRVPHDDSGKLTLQELNDNARAFTKALAIATGAHKAAETLAATVAGEKPVNGGWGAPEEKGADPTLPENMRTTRAVSRGERELDRGVDGEEFGGESGRSTPAPSDGSSSPPPSPAASQEGPEPIREVPPDLPPPHQIPSPPPASQLGPTPTPPQAEPLNPTAPFSVEPGPTAASPAPVPLTKENINSITSAPPLEHPTDENQQVPSQSISKAADLPASVLSTKDINLPRTATLAEEIPATALSKSSGSCTESATKKNPRKRKSEVEPELIVDGKRKRVAKNNRHNLPT